MQSLQYYDILFYCNFIAIPPLFQLIIPPHIFTTKNCCFGRKFSQKQQFGKLSIPDF